MIQGLPCNKRPEPIFIKAAEWETNNSAGDIIAIGAHIPFDTEQFDNAKHEITLDTTNEQFKIRGRSVWLVQYSVLATASTGAAVNLVANAAIVMTTPLSTGVTGGQITGSAILNLPNEDNLVWLTAAGAALTLNSNNAASYEQATITFIRLA